MQRRCKEETACREGARQGQFSDIRKNLREPRDADKNVQPAPAATCASGSEYSPWLSSQGAGSPPDADSEQACGRWSREPAALGWHGCLRCLKLQGRIGIEKEAGETALLGSLISCMMFWESRFVVTCHDLPC